MAYGLRYDHKAINKQFPKGSHCGGCPLRGIGLGFARTDGTGSNGVLLLGEALGETEAAQGLPFKGQAGSVLNAALHLVPDSTRQDFLIANTICCRPPKNILEGAWFESEVVERCSPYFLETLKANPQIRVIVPMGNVPLRKILGINGIGRARGYVYDVEIGGSKYKAVPTLHPAGVMREESKEFYTLLKDLEKSLHIAQHGFERTPVAYITHPSVTDAVEWVDAYREALRADSDLLLACDIETPYSETEDEDEVDIRLDNSTRILRVSFAYKLNEAISIPWTDEYKPAIKRALYSLGQKAWWNGDHFDLPRIKAAEGWDCRGDNYDFMNAWHFYQPDLPKRLDYVAPFFTDVERWKHTSKTEPERYSAQDADVTLRIALALRTTLRERPAPNNRTAWQVFCEDLHGLEPIKRVITATGVGIDNKVRDELIEHYTRLKNNANEVIQEAVPHDLKPLLKKGHYKGLNEEVRAEANARGLSKPKRKGKLKDPIANAARQRDYKRKLDVYEARLRDVWRDLGYEWFEDEHGRGWNKRVDFNPQSSDQILAYIRAKYGDAHVPRHPRTREPTAGRDGLERLARRKNDGLLETIVQVADANKNLTTFLANWKKDPKTQRLHPEFYDNPATLRFSSKNPNGQNFPRRRKESAKMREMIIPGNEPHDRSFATANDDDWLLGEIDFSGVEAVYVGHYAKDPDYVWLAQRGIHTHYSSVLLADADFLDEPIDRTMPKPDLEQALKEVKKIAKATIVPDKDVTFYDAAKPTVHMTNYLGQPRLLTNIYPEVYANEKEAERLQGLYINEWPSIRQWQVDTLLFADTHKYLENDWGYRRPFFDALKWHYNEPLKKWERDPRKKYCWGRQAKKIIAHNPQSSLAGLMRWVLRDPRIVELVLRKLIMLQIHDSLLYRARKRHFASVTQTMVEVMSAPIPFHGGLTVPVEVNVGPNWNNMTEWKG